MAPAVLARFHHTPRTSGKKRPEQAKSNAQATWLGIDDIRFGIIGMAVSLVAMVVVSLATKEPSKEVQAMVDEVRVPSGKTILTAGH